MRVRCTATCSTGNAPNIGVTISSASIEPAPTIQLSQNGTIGSNPCVNPHAAITLSVVALSGTSLTQFVALSGTTKIYPCFILVANATATTTLEIEYGTGTNCAGGTAVYTGPFTIPASTAAPLVINGMMPPMAAGNAACYILTGTTPTGAMTFGYVQQ
jgi:hypothetical protein